MLPFLFERLPKIELPEPSAVECRGFGFRGPINFPFRLGGACHMDQKDAVIWKNELGVERMVCCGMF